MAQRSEVNDRIGWDDFDGIAEPAPPRRTSARQEWLAARRTMFKPYVATENGRPVAPPVTMLAAALAYARKGWPVFPCLANKAPDGELAPNGFYDATTDAATITRWWTRHPDANIGFEPGSVSMMAVDLDSYKSDFDRRAVEKAFGGLPKTHLRAKSPRGGEHLFYALADGEVVASPQGVGGGADVCSFGGYVLLGAQSDGRWRVSVDRGWQGGLPHGRDGPYREHRARQGQGPRYVVDRAGPSRAR